MTLRRACVTPLLLAITLVRCDGGTGGVACSGDACNAEGQGGAGPSNAEPAMPIAAGGTTADEHPNAEGPSAPGMNSEPEVSAGGASAGGAVAVFSGEQGGAVGVAGEPGPDVDGSAGTVGGEPEPVVNPEPSIEEPEPSVMEPSPSDSEGPSSSRLTAVPSGTDDAPLGYWEYLPPGYGDAPVPLLVFTHGAAWQGDGSEAALQDLLEVGPPNLISTDQWPNERPFLVLSPQNPRSGCFDPNDIDAFYRYALDTYEVDTSRIYHTGQSCGAIGAWGYLAEHLDEFVTAAVLISGDGQAAVEQAGCELGRIAIWALHNENDMSVPSTGTTVPIDTLLECEPVPDVRATIYPDESAHDAWTKTYDLSAGHDVYGWLLEHTHP